MIDLGWQRYKLVAALDGLAHRWVDMTSPPDPDPSRVAVVRLDAIGDYLLTRNYFDSVRRAYPNAHITYIGLPLVKSLAERFDRDVFDEFVWLDYQSFSMSLSARWRLFRQLREGRYGVVLNPTSTRNLTSDDVITRMIGAPRTSGFEGEVVRYRLTERQRARTIQAYQRAVPVRGDRYFELERLADFFAQALDQPYDPRLRPLALTEADQPEGLPGQYIVLFPGANARVRQWPTAHFAQAGRYLHELTGLPLVLVGGPADTQAGQDLEANLSPTLPVLNLIGATSLVGYAAVIAGAALVICNETSAVHMAAPYGRPTVVVSNGQFYERFTPYPAEYFPQARTLFPPVLEAERIDTPRAELRRRYLRSSHLSIDTITPERVMEAASQLLTHYAPELLVRPPAQPLATTGPSY